MRYLIVIPTIRQSVAGFDQTMQAIRDSLTQPTDLRILDGREGKAQTLNAAYQTILRASDCDVYVTMDDDYLPEKGWQEALDQAFVRLKGYGALAPWLGEENAQYMNLHWCDPETRVRGAPIRRVRHNIAGCMIAFRRQAAVAIGPIPDSPEKYQYWEDGWRCRRLKDLRLKMAYVMNARANLFSYQDPEGYLRSKSADIAAAKRRGGAFEHVPSVWERGLNRLRHDLGRLRKGKGK